LSADDSNDAHGSADRVADGSADGAAKDAPPPANRIRPRPLWQLPLGVSPGLWEYAHTDFIATDYDNYFAFNRMFEFDEQVVLRSIERHGGKPGQWVADLGCGTGRALVFLARHGYRGLAIDLSQRMLQIVAQKARQEDLPIACLRANLVELDGLADQSIDHACSLFSTLGMIRGREYRRQLLRHVRRVLRPGGVLVLHVHNRWFNLYDPGGPWWLLRSYLDACLRPGCEVGDKVFPYRGLNNMFLHVFTKGELGRDLRKSGFRVRQWIPLDPRRHQQLRWPWLASRLRANGWIVVCT
jgi:ubiquinone/menaquinone biosynthesis C-methylase UbiE